MTDDQTVAAKAEAMWNAALTHSWTQEQEARGVAMIEENFDLQSLTDLFRDVVRATHVVLLLLAEELDAVHVRLARLESDH